jgi:hypothetical protein
MRRRVAFWTTVSSPLLVIAVALLIGALLELLGADCVTYGNNPMALDNTTVCNQLGETQSDVGWAVLGLLMVLLPVAFVTGAVGAWRAVKRRAR